jgi:hypothetical protein
MLELEEGIPLSKDNYLTGSEWKNYSICLRTAEAILRGTDEA